MTSILVVDVGWAQVFRLAGDLAAVGLRVHVVGGDTGKAWLLPPGVSTLPGRIDPLDAPGMIATIGQAQQQCGADRILALAEPVLAACWRYLPSWIDRLLPAVEPEHRPLFSHKQRMLDHLAPHGVPVPRGAWLQRGDDREIEAAGRDLGWPLVVKVPNGYAGHGVVIASHLAEAVQAVRGLWSDDPARRPTLQAWLPGATRLVGGLFEQGRAVHLIGAERTACGGSPTGPALRLRTDAQPPLLDAARRCFEVLGYTGIACADFVDNAAGRPQLVDVNPRPWGSIGVARAAGIDLIGAWARRLQGDEAALPPEARPGIDWVKIPDYLWPEATSGLDFLSRLLQPVVWRSWSRHRAADFLIEIKLAQYLLRQRLREPRGERDRDAAGRRPPPC